MKPDRNKCKLGMDDRITSGPDRCHRAAGFTLVELLVVISIIAVLAGLTVGLSGVAGRKSKEGRMRGDLNRLVTVIEDYKAKIGYYPPSPEGLIRRSNDPFDIPNPPFNQLFYELSGTLFTNPSGSVQNGRFSVLGRPAGAGLTATEITQLFQADGFSNSAREKRGVRFTTDFKAADVREINTALGPRVEILVAPVPPPVKPLTGPYIVTSSNGAKYYPWFYDASSSGRMNTDRFDLWTVVEIGKKFVRFSNWESGPVVVGP